MGVDQGKKYNEQYKKLVFDEQGLPDLKIVDYNKEIKGKKILSIGAGVGADLWFLTKTNKVEALDASSFAVNTAKRHDIKAKVADVSKKLPYISNSFDIVVLKDILEHLLDPVALLLEAKRVVKKKGYLIISLPNHFWWWFRFRILFGKNLLWKTLQHSHVKDFEEWNYMHVRFFTWHGVKKLMQKVDLKIVKEYWDFGTWAHYSDPEMFYTVLKNKKNKSFQARLFLKIMYPIYSLVNLVFPRKIRAKIVKLNPGLFCAGFYLKVKK